MRGLRWRRRPSRALYTAATGPFAQLLEIGLPTFEAYASRHGFDLVAFEEDRAAGRPAPWGKIPILQEALDTHELVVWIDADAIIVDGSRDLSGEVRHGKDLYLVEHRHEPSGEVTANTGVMMLRAGAWARKLLASAWAQVDLIDHQWWENAAIMRLLGYQVDVGATRRGPPTEWTGRTRVLAVDWNSMPHWCWSATPVINHYAGLPMEERRARMSADLAQRAP